MPSYTMPDGSVHEFDNDEIATMAYKAWDAQYGAADKKEGPPQPVSAQVDQEPSIAAKIAANPLTRFATSAASPFMGAGELVPGPIGEFFAQNNAELKRLVEEGKVGQDDLTKIAGSAYDLAGTIMSPAFLKLAKVLPAAKSFWQMVKQGAGVGALAGATAPTGSTDLSEKAIATGTGALVGGAATPVVSGLARMGTNAVAPLFSESAAERGAARLATKVAGPQKRSVVADLFTRASPNETAAEAAMRAGSYETSALQKYVGSLYMPSEYGALRAGGENARLARLKAITPDKAAAMSAREEAANATYGRAFSSDAQRLEELNRALDAQALSRTGGIQVPSAAPSVPTGSQTGVSRLTNEQKAYLGVADDVDQFAIPGPKPARELTSVETSGKGPDYAPTRGSSVLPQIKAFEGNPVFQAAAKEARNLAASMGEDIGNPMASLKGLHYIKIAIDNQFKTPNAPTALQNYQKGALTATKDRLLKAIEGTQNEPGISPLYGLARKQYAELSPPVNQAEVLERLATELPKPAGAGERTTPFLNLLEKGEETLIKKSTGMPRYVVGDIKKILTPTQMSVVDDIVGQLKSGAELTRQEKEGMSAAVKALRAELDPTTAPNLLNAKVSFFNSLLRMIEGTGGRKVEKKLAELMLPGKAPRLGQLMKEYQESPYGMLSGPVRMGGIPSAVSATGLFGERE